MGIKNFQLYVERFFGLQCFKEFNVRQVSYNMKDFSQHEVCNRVLDSFVKAENPKKIVKYDNAYMRCGLYIDLASVLYGCMLKSLENNTNGFSKLSSNSSLVNEKTVIAELDDSTINNIVTNCTDALIEILKPLLLKSYRIYISYDSHSPRAKVYEQSCRKRRSCFSLSYSVKTECYKRIMEKVKEMVTSAHIQNLIGYLSDLGLVDVTETEEICRKIVESAVAEQFSLDSTPFGEGEWKCFYRIHEDINDGVVDSCFVFGRDWDIGFAMTMYQHPTTPGTIKYVFGPVDMLEHVKIFDTKERMLHFACLMLIGNDYVGGLVNPSDTNLKTLKTEFDRLYYGQAGATTALHSEYLSTTLFGNGSPEVEDSNDDTGSKMKIGVAFAVVFSRLLSAVYTSRQDRIETVLSCGENNPSCSNETKYKKTPTDGTTVLACKDSQGNRVSRTFQQCMDSFAVAVLWYLSYTRFYFFSKSGRERFSTIDRPTDDLPMSIGLRMGKEHVFMYNDSRLSPNHRYDVHRLLDFKKIMCNMEPYVFFDIVKNAFVHALDSKNTC